MLLLILLAALLSFLLTGVATWYAKRRGLVDHPGERHSHTEPTPRGGGAGWVLAFFLFIAAEWAIAGPGYLAFGGLAFVLGGMAVLAMLGWWDDHHDLDARQRGTTAWVVSPILFFVLMAGPLGFALYLGARALVGRMNGGSLELPATAPSEV